MVSQDSERAYFYRARRQASTKSKMVAIGVADVQARRLVQPGGGPRGGVDRDSGQPSGRVVGAEYLIGTHVKAMVRVQVAEADRVYLVKRAVALERAKRAVAEVEQQPESLGLDQVTRRRTIGAWEAARASHDRQIHGL